MKASSAKKLAQKNQTKVDIDRADEFIAQMYIRVKTDATSGNYSSFMDIPKDIDHENYHKYIIAEVEKNGYEVNIDVIYDRKGHNRVYKLTWGEL